MSALTCVGEPLLTLTAITRQTCTLNILMHLPRSVFSQRQLDLFLWLLKVNDVDDVPSVKSMQTLNTMLQKMCGIDSIKYEGALGHSYYVNSLSQIIAQVFSPISLITSIIHVLAGNGQSEGQSTPQVLS